MLCVVAGLSNCDCIWINCSMRLLFATLALPADDVELPEDELPDAPGVVIVTVEPSA
jgi:hypothetical protein